MLLEHVRRGVGELFLKSGVDRRAEDCTVSCGRMWIEARRGRALVERRRRLMYIVAKVKGVVAARLKESSLQGVGAALRRPFYCPFFSFRFHLETLAAARY